MTFNAEKVTLASLTRVVQDNLAIAQGLGLRLSWGFDGTRIYARVYHGRYLCYEKYYNTGHVHMRLADMHNDWNQYLESAVHQRRKAFEISIDRKMKELAQQAREAEKEEMMQKRWQARRG